MLSTRKAKKRRGTQSQLHFTRRTTSATKPTHTGSSRRSSSSLFRRETTETEPNADGEVVISLLSDSYPQTVRKAAAAATHTQAQANGSGNHGNAGSSRWGETLGGRIRIAAVLSAVLCGVIVFGLVATDSGNSNTLLSKALIRNRRNRIKFRCPSRFQLGSEDEEYAEQYAVEAEEMTTDKKQFLANYKEVEFDQWDDTYTNVKTGLAPFKSKYYTKYIKNGMHIYESAMGTGLNLFMTLDLLREQKPPISGVTVYGNDLVKESIDQAVGVILADGVIPAGNHQGVLCTGNSLDLGHVPSSAFDLVYTGYITPVMDALHIVPAKDKDADDDDDSVWNRYQDICTAVENNKSKDDDDKDWMAEYLWERMILEQQRERYGKWVGEMARIAKPGVPVIVESVSVSYCEFTEDWGGVPKSFWKKAARENTYNWDVDPKSIEMMDDTLNEKRYHVFMLKNQ
uniref:Methyltransferase domain-containing protein n=1 Tax=Pseudo-nitzschia australis TaxID=44445 RepID=A0A7S4AL83_9STRA|mmetsp:Transcript_23151/g.50579  ORF Transcript_23151/g.50579 Transcript_23151/m.50579 type:complete len:457 (-) Transcript_23151:172-1542(-)|eukprot:CAMPEP_0168247146 /NCGR_PEP_ID=MMETSP0141_2-20121125/732_1 /TAXON_ID=44445 /ORGANISM="Pseudo-nitzschia australis, Strain 10249 10 AB" /LENGTH=456 /DNA_ID=CAMNT_0008182893 /DNA_START=224 /DNA_END=1594 /DNA_ORIENTATION=+